MNEPIIYIYKVMNNSNDGIGLFYAVFPQIIQRGSTKYSFSDKLWKELKLRTIKLLSLMHA